MKNYSYNKLPSSGFIVVAQLIIVTSVFNSIKINNNDNDNKKLCRVDAVAIYSEVDGLKEKKRKQTKKLNYNLQKI